MSSLSTPTAETSQASTSEASDSAQTMGALFSNIQPTVDTFDIDDDHSGHMEVLWNEKRQSRNRKKEANSLISRNTVTSQTSPYLLIMIS